jgi:uncharacterized protein (DUF4415 family)
MRMQKNPVNGSVEWIDPDDAPELDDAWFDRAVFKINGVEVSPRPKDVTETDVTLRLDSDVVEFFKAAGTDLDKRINGALRAAMAKAFAV